MGWRMSATGRSNSRCRVRRFSFPIWSRLGQCSGLFGDFTPQLLAGVAWQDPALGRVVPPRSHEPLPDAFVTLHGSWNRGTRTGYKVVRLIFKDGEPTGEYEDFMTGFVISDEQVGLVGAECG